MGSESLNSITRQNLDWMRVLTYREMRSEMIQKCITF